MKRLLISLILPLCSLFFYLEAYAQRDKAELEPVGEKGPAVAGPPILSVGRERSWRLDPKTAKKTRSGGFYEELLLNDAKSEDLLAFRIESGDPSLGLQIFDRRDKPVAVVRDASGDFRIDTLTKGLPASGDYRIRVTCAARPRNVVHFKIKVSRLGLTTTAYVERFKKIDANYRKGDPASVEETVAKLEELAKADPSRWVTFARIARIHLEDRGDAAKAEAAIERALQANGEFSVNVSFDNRWRMVARLRSGGYGFEDERQGQIVIQAGRLTLPDPSNRKPMTLTGQQISELSKAVVDKYALIKIVINNMRRTYVFAPETMWRAEADPHKSEADLRQAEGDMVVRLIQNYVIGRAN